MPKLIKKLLSEEGLLFIHIGQHASHFLRIICDEIFAGNFRNEIVVKRIKKSIKERELVNRLNVYTDSVLVYSKNPNAKILVPQKKESKEDRWHALDAPGLRTGMDYLLLGSRPPAGRHWAWSKDRAEEAVRNGSIRKKSGTGKPEYLIPASEYSDCDNLWDDISAYSFESGYPTEKSKKLLERIFSMHPKKEGYFADFFCGSGVSLIVAEESNYSWIGSDLSKTAIQVTRGRLVHQNSKPFLIQNLGNYQRQLVYSKEVKLKEMYNIVLKLFGATPRTDWQGFGISKEDNKTLVFVCEPDRPMTGKKAVDLAKSAKTADGKGYKRLIILAWDFEYDFDDTFQRLTKNSKRDLADVEFKIIPSDVYKYLRSTKVGDQDLANKITFYEKPYLRLSEPQVSKRDKEEAQVKIKIEQYVLRDIPVKDESKRPEIEKMLHKNFANLIDYWTVDWDYDGEVFRSKWQAIRDRKSSDPVSTTADTTLKRGKKYTIAVRVVDVFGNDASLTKEIDLR